MQQINIRKVEKTDSNQIINLMKKLSVQTKYMLRELDEVNDDILEQEKRIEGMLSDPRTLYLVAVADTTVIGMIISSSSALSRIKHISDIIIGVDRAYWSIGVGSKLMEALIKWAEDIGLKRLTLEVVEDNIKAIKLYEKYDFKIEGTKIADHFIGNDTYLNTIVMGKILDANIL
ncbi:GNAT family acetyltransferase YhhY [Fusibacter sp. 3D3]|nr:GNAT family acetyltransferase YhhY [Fusibacter sp. 3D3]